MGIEDSEVVSVSFDDQSSNSLLTNSRCCFCFPCFGSRGSSTVGLAWWERIRSSKGHSEDNNNNISNPKWWSKGVTALKKIREWSEIVAGPKWKTFIRRFNRCRRGGGGGGSGNSRHHGKFQYDPLSYSLNFDEGYNGNFADDECYDDYGGGFPRDFSSRYASVNSGKHPLSMDVSSLGKDLAATA